MLLSSATTTSHWLDYQQETNEETHPYTHPKKIKPTMTRRRKDLGSSRFVLLLTAAAAAAATTTTTTTTRTTAFVTPSSSSTHNIRSRSRSRSNIRRSHHQSPLIVPLSSLGISNSDNNDDGVIEYDDFDGFSIGKEQEQQEQPLTFNLEDLQKQKKKEERLLDLPDFDDFEMEDGSTGDDSNDIKQQESSGTGALKNSRGSENINLSEMLMERKISGGSGGGGAVTGSSSSGGGSQRDLSGVTTRQFSLGPDLIMTDYVGNLGFDEVTDWEYYYEDEDEDTSSNDSTKTKPSTTKRQVIQPNPFDSSKPKRTRTSSGSVVRVFRGELSGRLGGTLRSKGFDRRVLVREYTGKLALSLAEREQAILSGLQSNLVEDDEDAAAGDWIQAAASRSVLARKDDSYVGELLSKLSKAPFVGSIGEVNLSELDGEMDPNDFYRALGVPPPKPDAVWVVYEYVGLNTVASYAAMPPAVRRSQLPPVKKFFGFQDPPPLPPFRTRANYVINGIVKGMIEAVATMHEAGFCHKSISGNSFVLTAPNSQDKREPSTIYFTRTTGLSVKLQDFGFSCRLDDVSQIDPEFIGRARSFGFSFREGEASVDTTNFAMAEDIYALGFVVLGLLLTSLSEADNTQSMPQTDEDTLQRLLGEIFANDFSKFREYIKEEEVWDSLVELLDDNDGAGWTVLETLFNAREKVAATKGSSQIVTARGLVSNAFFQPIR